LKLERYLAKARLTLEHARVMLMVNLTKDAGRAERADFDDRIDKGPNRPV
jgi:hypothetical protein